MYWAYAPAATKIEKDVQKLLMEEPGKKPIDYLIVHDEDDRRLESNFLNGRSGIENFRIITDST